MTGVQTCALPIWTFIDRYASSENKERQLQVACLTLLLRYGHEDVDWWVATSTLRRHLESTCGEEIAEQKLRHVVGGLRDAGVLIASRTAGGYKLATCERDLVYFLERQNSQLEPMISRVQKARETVRRATGGNLDILGYDEYRMLGAAVSAVEKCRIARERDDGDVTPDAVSSADNAGS